MRLTHTLAGVVLALSPVAGLAQAPPRPPASGPAPLLYARVIAPQGASVTVYQGSPVGRPFAAPVVLGLRPGYIHRLEITGLPGHPGAALYPTLEVRGTLQLPPNLRAAEYPAPVVLSADDIDRALAGALVTKVVYLESPEKAVATATLPDQPIEVDLRPGDDPLAEARDHGRPMLVIRFGARTLGAEEMARETVPGTVMAPGDRALPPPPMRPYLPWACWPVYDPYLGPRPPEEECLKDGGDAGPKAGFDQQGRLRGVDPADTVAEYTDSKGRKHVSASNRVCICVPRFAALRLLTPLAGYETTQVIARSSGLQERGQFDMRLPARQAQLNEQVSGVHGRLRASAATANEGLVKLIQLRVLNAIDMDIGPGRVLGTNAALRLTEEQRVRLAKQLEVGRQFSVPYGTREFEGSEVGPQVVGRVEGLKVLAKIEETRDVTVACNEAPRRPDRPLVLFKWADKQSAQVGDVVTFFLKYSNVGGQPITDVAVSDSLTGRLEYVPGSAKADRDAVFTMQQNEAGSLVLRWEIGGTLQPGQSGVVSFQAKVR